MNDLRIELSNNWILSQDAYLIYKDSMYKSTYEKYIDKIKSYIDNNYKIYICKNNNINVGIIIANINNNIGEIVGISVKDNYRKHGIGKYMINELMKKEMLNTLEAETDDDAVSFYKNCGFTINKIIKKYNNEEVIRYKCIMLK